MNKRSTDAWRKWTGWRPENPAINTRSHPAQRAGSIRQDYTKKHPIKTWTRKRNAAVGYNQMIRANEMEELIREIQTELHGKQRKPEKEGGIGVRAERGRDRDVTSKRWWVRQQVCDAIWQRDLLAAHKQPLSGIGCAPARVCVCKKKIEWQKQVNVSSLNIDQCSYLSTLQQHRGNDSSLISHVRWQKRAFALASSTAVLIMYDLSNSSSMSSLITALSSRIEATLHLESHGWKFF